MTPEQICGIFTALITPMTHDGIDEPALEKLVDWQIAQGVHGLVPCGTTGESPTLTHEEHKRVIEIVTDVAAGRVHIMAGAGSNSTDETLDFTRHAHKVGVDSVLLVSPYYNKPNAAGQYAHFSHIAREVEVPIVIYNIPGRSVIDISDDTLLKLAEDCWNIVGVKDATGDLARVARLHHRAGDRLALLSGEDITALGFNAMGGQGCISVSSNVAPAACAALQNASLGGNYAEAKTIHDTLIDLHEVMFSDTSPIPVKHALYLMGYCQEHIRMPLVKASTDVAGQVKDCLIALDLL